ncbi:uncharacterized protein LOC125777052 isoform X1 [Bactrocera dorsalis]|uniref:Uncharacterized protein LOC125777052 isoform X1 n=1 Tax=Bactrocera dorsalis TaxID=27457 RepID=A0ABM3JCB1_BACDO|nr:uncharacterized protein LOC125777052 isoform X1 [Bactrocera dorsalis]
MSDSLTRCIILIALSIQAFVPNVYAIKYTFTKMECEALDQELLQFEDCGVNADHEAHMRLKVLKPPLDNISVGTSHRFSKYSGYIEVFFFSPKVRVVLMKHTSGEYRSFFLNTEYDVCRFLKSQRNPLVQYLFQFLKPYTSLNHKCPFPETSMYLNNFRVNASILRPMKIVLDGNYSFFSTWMTHKVNRMKIDLYFTWEA